MESSEENFSDERANDEVRTEEEIKNPHPHRNSNLWVWILIGVLTLGGCVFGAVMVVKGIGDFGDKIADNIVDKVAERVEPIREKNDENDSGEKQFEYIGDETNGYVKVEKGLWTKVETENNQSLRYYAGIYTLLITVMAEQADQAFVYADSLYGVAVDSPNTSNATLNKQQLGKYEEAYKLVSKDELSGTWSEGWVFAAADGKVHYVLVQGLDREDERFKIPETFVLKKPEEANGAEAE